MLKEVLRTVLTFALLIIAILLLFRLSTYSLLSGNLRAEIVLATVAIVFFFIGLYINNHSLRQNNPPVRQIDHQKLKKSGLSNREYEVLKEAAHGLSNKQIADKLFVSESTIKTHVSNILLKLNAERRTQAIQIAKELNIL